MYKFGLYVCLGLVTVCLWTTGCKVPAAVTATENRSVPGAYNDNKDTTNTSTIPWRSFFTDKNLAALIDIALRNNQELKITLQEIEIAKNEIRLRQGPLTP